MLGTVGWVGSFGVAESTNEVVYFGKDQVKHD